MLGIASALLYAGTAVSMNFVNKATVDAFPLAWSVLLLQMVATVLLVLPLWAIGAVDFPRLSLDKAKQLAPVSVFYAMNTAFALLGLRSLNIPMYSTLKRLTPIIVLLFNVAVTRTWPAAGLTASVLCVVAGCIVAAIGDLTFDAMGYLFALVSCCLQAIYLLLVEFSSTYRNVGSAEMLFYNGLLALPPLAVMVVVTGEYRIIGPAFISATLASPSFPALLAMCSVLGTLLNLSLFLCTINNSALTTTVVGVLKGVLVTVLGFFLLGGVEFHPLNVLGIGLNTIGGVCYAAIKYRQKQRYTASGNRLKPESAVQVQIDSTSFSAQSAPMNPLVQRGSGLNADVHVSAARERFIHPWMEI